MTSDPYADDVTGILDRLLADADERGETLQNYLCKILGSVIGYTSLTHGAEIAIGFTRMIQQMCDGLIEELGGSRLIFPVGAWWVHDEESGKSPRPTEQHVTAVFWGFRMVDALGLEPRTR